MDMNEYNAWLQAAWNRPQEVNPYGSLTYSFDDEGNLVRETQLSPEQQKLLEQRQQTDLGLGGMAQDQMALAQGQGAFAPTDLPQMPGGGGFDEERQRIEEEIYKRDAAVLDERFAREQDQLIQYLYDTGKTPGTEAWENALREFGENKDNAYSQARQGAVAFAGQEQQARYGMGMGARQQAYGEQLQQYQLPYQTMGGVLGMQAGIQNPAFTPMQGINMPGVDVAGTALGYAGLASNERVAQIGANASMHNAMLGSGGPSHDPFALQQQAHQHKLEQIAAQNANRPSSGSSPSLGQQFLGSAIPAFAGGWAMGGFKSPF
jgi:hypothetical protein